MRRPKRIEIPSADPDEVEAGLERIQRELYNDRAKALEIPPSVNPYSAFAMGLSDVELGGQIYTYGVEVGKAVLRYECPDTSLPFESSEWSSTPGQLAIMTNNRLMRSSEIALAKLAIVPNPDGSWEPAVSFPNSEIFESVIFTDAWHQLLN
jgi:hypothetical protein